MTVIPIIGLGTWSLTGETATSAVCSALACGYRLIDTARLYENEEAVGMGLQQAFSSGIVSREDVFVTTKILPSSYSVRGDLENSLKKLQLDYVDCLMLHWHGNHDDAIYADIMSAVDDGLVKMAGISGFYTEKGIRHFVEDFDLAPAVVQNENHLFFQNQSIKNFLKKQNILLQSFYPLGGRGRTHQMLEHPEVKTIASKHGKSPAQVVLRWHVQHGFCPIPGSGNPVHIRENLAIFDFELTQAEMQCLNGLEKGTRFEMW